MSYRKIVQIIKADGWVHIRTCGSHCQFFKIGYAETVVVPCHGSKDVSIGVVLSIERITGLSLRG